MNAKLLLWTGVVQFVPFKALICAYIDLASPKSPSLQLIGFLPNAISSSNIVKSMKWSDSKQLAAYTLARSFTLVPGLPLLTGFASKEVTVLLLQVDQNPTLKKPTNVNKIAVNIC